MARGRSELDDWLDLSSFVFGVIALIGVAGALPPFKHDASKAYRARRDEPHGQIPIV
jgi:hypothetical protein